MGITIICVVVLAVSIFVLFHNDDVIAFALSLFLSCIAGIATLIMIIAIAFTQVNGNTSYQKDMNTYSVLQSLADKEEVNSSIALSTDIIEYNKKVIEARCWSDNFWTKGFYYPKQKDLPLVVINGEAQEEMK